MASRVTSMRLPETIQAQVDTRAGADGAPAFVIRRDLERYYEALAWERQELRKRYTPAELSLIADACLTVIFDDTAAVRMLWAEVADAIRLEGLAEKWGVDGAALVKQLQEQPLTADAALVDAIERWKGTPADERVDAGQMLEEMR